jgi:hypothetical protein
MFFYGNPETAVSNAFQKLLIHSPTELLVRAQEEFDHSVSVLRDAGITVWVMDADPNADTPDAIFPNNWFSTHTDGRCVLYPMATPNRRLERRWPVLSQYLRDAGFKLLETVDLTAFENQGRFLEGTGSLIFDGLKRRVFAAESIRTDKRLVEQLAQQLGLEPVCFSAFDTNGLPIYHTNVLMALAPTLAVVTPNVIAAADRHRVLTALAEDRELLEISVAQMQCFAGNVLFLSVAGEPLVVLSCQAWDSLTASQRRQMESHARVLKCKVPTIEAVGGGGIRCMLAEIFLPKIA